MGLTTLVLTTSADKLGTELKSELKLLLWVLGPLSRGNLHSQAFFRLDRTWDSAARTRTSLVDGVSVVDTGTFNCVLRPSTDRDFGLRFPSCSCKDRGKKTHCNLDRGCTSSLSAMSVRTHRAAHIAQFKTKEACPPRFRSPVRMPTLVNEKATWNDAYLPYRATQIPQ